MGTEALTPQQRYARSERGLATARAKAKRLRDADPEAARARERAWADANPGAIRGKGIRRYGISVVRWLATFHQQGECCALCRCTEPGPRGWATDHDHETGEVRGILCPRCNLCLGWLGDTLAVAVGRLGRIGIYLCPRSN